MVSAPSSGWVEGGRDEDDRSRGGRVPARRPEDAAAPKMVDRRAARPCSAPAPSPTHPPSTSSLATPAATTGPSFKAAFAVLLVARLAAARWNIVHDCDEVGEGGWEGWKRGEAGKKGP